MKNVHLLPTDKPSRLYQKENRFQLSTHPAIDWYISSASYKPVNIYITFSDEEIKEGDWYYHLERKTVHNTSEKADYFVNNTKYGKFKKIILTTDQDLINDGVQDIEDEFLEWFVKNPSCEFVDTFIDAMGCAIEHCNANPCINYKIIIPQEEPKQETLEEAAILNCQSITHPYWDREKLMFIKGAKWQAERMYSEEEVISIVEKSRETGLTAEYLLLTDQYKKK
jgi:hypothetical protein